MIQFVAKTLIHNYNQIFRQNNQEAPFEEKVEFYLF